MTNYGAAAKYDFDNPQKWYTEKSVPLLDEHEMTSQDGQPIATVDRAALIEIANNNNKRVRETGDPATLILGHTSDDPRAPEKPAKGFVVNYHVKPFKRDPKTRQVVFAIHGDYKLRPQNAHLLEQYPRRSVELWWHKKELDPVAMLGGSTPERDLGVVMRKARFKHIAVLGGTVPERDLGTVVRFSRRGTETVETYSIEDSRVNSRTPGPRRFACPPGLKNSQEPNMGPNRYADDMMGSDDLGGGADDYDAGDDGIPGEGEGPDSAESDPVLAKLFQSKQWKQLTSQISQLAEALGGAEPGMEGDDGMGGEMPPPGAGAAPPPGAPMGAPPPGAEAMGDDYGEPEEDERSMHGDKPVQMDMGGGGTGFPGGNNAYQPGFNGKKNMNRTRVQSQPKKPVSRVESELTQLKKQNHTLRLRYARSEATTIVNDLVAEGVLFGDTPESHHAAVAKQVDDFTAMILHDDDHNDKYTQERVDEIRTCYRRKRPDPAAPASVGLARYTRKAETKPADGTGDDDSFEQGLTDEQTVEFANLQSPMAGPRRMSRQDAQKAIKKRYGM